MAATAITSNQPAPTWLWFGSTTVGMYPRATPISPGTVAAVTTEAVMMPIRRSGRDGSGGRHEHAPPGAQAEHRCQQGSEDKAEQGPVVQAAATELLLGPAVADEDHQRQQQGEHPRVAEHQAEGLQPEEHRDGQHQDGDREDARTEVACHDPSVQSLVRPCYWPCCDRLAAAPR